MEITTVYYRDRVGRTQEFQGDWKKVEGGIVFILSNQSQYFVPYSGIVGIEQTMSVSGTIDAVGRSLSHRLQAGGR